LNATDGAKVEALFASTRLDPHLFMGRRSIARQFYAGVFLARRVTIGADEAIE